MTIIVRNETLRFAEAVCAGHPDRLADAVADGIVALATARDPEALVGVEVALHRRVVFVDGRIAAGRGPECAVSEDEVVSAVRRTFARAGYGAAFAPASDTLEVRFDLCLGPLEPDERLFRRVADDQVVGVGYACRGERAGMIPLEQALARDFAKAFEALRSGGREAWLGPDGKALVVVRGRRLVAVSLSLHHVPAADGLALCALAKEACLAVAAEYAAALELEPPGRGGRLALQRRGLLRRRRPARRQRPLREEARRRGLRLRGADRRRHRPRQGPPQARRPRPAPRPRKGRRACLPGPPRGDGLGRVQAGGRGAEVGGGGGGGGGESLSLRGRWVA